LLIQDTTADGQPAYKLVLEDRYAVTKEGGAPVDSKGCDDIVPLGGYRTADGYIIAEFSRSLIASDPQDRSVLPGKQGVIWAWGEGSTLGYHGANRGSSVVVFIDDETTLAAYQPSSPTFFDLVSPNVKIPKIETAYWCNAVTIPESVGSDPVHITDIDFVLPKDPEAASLIHHILV
jgi:hypothetical protein